MPSKDLLILILISIISLFILPSCFFNSRLSQAEKYITSHPTMNPEVKESILKGVVIIGMCPNEAIAAAGSPGPYKIIKDHTKWGPDVPPPIVALAQCKEPDNSIIELGFRNKVQFISKKPIIFWVRFEQGKAVSIKRSDELIDKQ